MFREVPVLPVVVPLAVLVLVLATWHLRRTGMLTAPRATVGLAWAVYAAGVVANTIFPIYLDKPGGGPRTGLLNLTLGSGYEPADALMNICVFVPVGVLVALVAPRWPAWAVLAAATALSLVVETTQLVTARKLGGGHVADVNDLLFNLVGAALGLLLLSAASRIPAVTGLVDRFRWAWTGADR
ncbi:hypothetical protein GCM10023340_04880 [Nocardioides marinquilinus]|uniref:VanZ-like domain-containing protein n=1 Tax=Nocardioides marinquilinus TaxID=1210400 RepID=A0ABP9P7F5_9ACTN